MTCLYIYHLCRYCCALFVEIDSSWWRMGVEGSFGETDIDAGHRGAKGASTLKVVGSEKWMVARHHDHLLLRLTDLTKVRNLESTVGKRSAWDEGCQFTAARTG